MAKTKQNSVYRWVAKNKQGKVVKGEVSALNVALVKVQLRKQGLVPSKISKAAQPLFGLDFSKNIKHEDITFFIRQMATMIKAGVPLVQSFDIVADGVSSPKMKNVINQLRDSVASGNDFASALRQHPALFDDLTCNLIAAGEQSGALESMLDRVAVYKEKMESLRRKIKKALTYPAITLLIAAAVTILLLVKVVPTFQEMFQSFGAELPAPTQLVVFISEMAQQYWLPIVGSLVAAAVVFVLSMKRSQKFKDSVQALLLRLPVIGNLIEKASVARFSRVLSTTFAAGVPLVEALDSVAGAVGNAVYRDAIYKVRDEVAGGQQMHFAMRNTQVFPSMLIQMTSIGEESGALDEMLDNVAFYYEEEVDAAVDGLTALIEPMLMVFLGVVVGGMIIAMYLPIFEMGNAI